MIFIIAIIFCTLYAGYYMYSLYERRQNIAQSSSFVLPYTVEIADDANEHRYGLMNRDTLCETCGMLFVFDTEEPRSFWMKNTKISLDMIFMNKKGVIVTIFERTTPFQEFPTYTSSPSMFVLEINGGQASELSLQVGSKIDIDYLKLNSRPFQSSI